MKITFGNITPFILLTLILLVIYAFGMIDLVTAIFPIIFYFVYNIIWVTILYFLKK